MQQGITKGLKTLSLKWVALLIGVCYLTNPLHQQINTVLHTLSHSLEIPDYIISHDSVVGLEYTNHGHNEHVIDKTQHDHAVLDFINIVFKTSKEKDGSDETLLSETKLDKHICTYQFQLMNCVEIKIPQSFFSTKNKSLKGYFKNPEEPPKYPIG